MVMRLTFIVIIWFAQVEQAMAVLAQTTDDLQRLEDDLTQAIQDDATLTEKILPILVPTAMHYWTESRDDFDDVVKAMLQRRFPSPGSLIDCSECDTHRLHMQEEARININNGPLSIGEFQKIRQVPTYASAKSVVLIKETPSGVFMRIVSIADGAMLYVKLANSAETLDNVRVPMNYAREYHRREREEALGFVRINIGFLPKPLFQVDFEEQWGSRNQHMSGVSLSLIGPIGAIGANYRYMLPMVKTADIGLGIFFPVQNLALPGGDAGESIKAQVYQAMASYGIGNSFGVFTAFSIGAETNFSVGISFYNPLLMPFLL
jgi:hypothetical protein